MSQKPHNTTRQAGPDEEPRLLDLIRQAGDADLGATLVRLAQMATAVHQGQALRESQTPCIDTEADAMPSSTLRRPIYTEVTR